MQLLFSEANEVKDDKNADEGGVKNSKVMIKIKTRMNHC
jgi:hypothetical protein